MTNEEQLAQWVAGNPQHRGERSDPQSECCPDFSCCTPELLAPLDVRERFAKARREGDKRTANAMLGGFLGAAIARAFPEKRVHVTDGSEPTPDQ